MFFAQALQMDTFCSTKSFSGAIACTLLDSPYVIELYFPMIGEMIKIYSVISMLRMHGVTPSHTYKYIPS